MKRFNSIFSILLVLIFATSFLSGCNKSSSDSPIALTVGNGDQAANSDDNVYEKRQTSFNFGDPNGDPNKVNLLFVGELNMGGNITNTVMDPNRGNGDFTYPFKRDGVKEALENADIAYANLECVISHNAPNQLTGDKFIAPKAAGDGLKYAGFDIVSLANDHTDDGDLMPRPFKATEFDNTIYNLDIAGVRYVGGGYHYDDAYAPIIGNVRGHKIAYIAFGAFKGGSKAMAKKASTKAISSNPQEKCLTKASTSGIAYADLTENTFTGRYELNAKGAEKVKTAIASAKAQEAKFIIVDMHMGELADQLPEADMISVMHRIMDLGADMVINSHINKRLPAVSYHNGVIAYSLGNFLAPNNCTSVTQDGYALEVEINFDSEGEVSGIAATPHKTRISDNQATFEN